MSEETAGIIRAMVRKYGEPPEWLAREVEEYVREELDISTSDKRERIYKAISRSCKMADGFPDPAAVRSAIWQAQQDGLGDLTRPRRNDWRAEDHAPAPVDEALVHYDWQEMFERALEKSREVKR